ncbi:hypothetical protein GCM10009750_29780 [Agromyces salentinus]|uniref:Uncharacterized protein n=1 Tax=Agromyces salentinus TaxID=269421 RepID=A0ABP4Z5B1_9MICO
MRVPVKATQTSDRLGVKPASAGTRASRSCADAARMMAVMGDMVHGDDGADHGGPPSSRHGHVPRALGRGSRGPVLDSLSTSTTLAMSDFREWLSVRVATLES